MTTIKKTLYTVGATTILALTGISCTEMDKPVKPRGSLEDECYNGGCDSTFTAPCDSATVLVISDVVDTTAIDLCEAVQVSINYQANSIPGIRDIIWKNITKDTCGYIAAPGSPRNPAPGIVGSNQGWQIIGLIGDPDSVRTNMEKFGNDILTVQTYLKDDQGNDASIVWPGNQGEPGTATHVQVIIGEVENSEVGMGYLTRQGHVDVGVDLFGRHISVRESGNWVVPIVNPPLMPYRLTLETPWITAQRMSKASADSLLTLYGRRP